MRFVPAVLLVACAPGRSDWEDVPITEAWLDDFDLSTLAAIGGAVEGDAVLEYRSPDGDGGFPVHLGGGTVGAVFDLSLDPEGHDGSVDLDLTEVKTPSVGDVLGTYHGTAGGGALLVGGEGRKLRNGRHVAFREDHFALGLAVYGGFEWVAITLGGNDGVDTGFPSHDTAAVDTAAVDTGTVDTGTAGTDPDIAASTPDRSGAGCGGGCEPCSGGSGGIAGLIALGGWRRRKHAY